MAKVTKRIAKSGATTDGRKLPKDVLSAIAKNYDRSVYAAKLNIEHYVSMYPDSPFSEQGDVLSLSTEPAPNNEIYLLAEMDTSSAVDDMWNAGKKRAFSIEYDPNFADLAQPYLVGLAVTSTPASLGTHFTSIQQKSATGKPTTTRFTFTESSVGFDDHANYTVEHVTMSDPAKTTDDKSTPPPPTVAAPAQNTPEQSAAPADRFSTALQHFSTELAAVRAERDRLQAELTAAAQKYSTDIAAKDAEILSLKEQIPAAGFKPVPLFTGSEGKADQARF
jgi:hypothetical protein